MALSSLFIVVILWRWRLGLALPLPRGWVALRRITATSSACSIVCLRRWCRTWRYALRGSCSRRNIRAIAQVLSESARVACYFLILVCRERDTGNEANGKPRPPSYTVSVPVLAVVTVCSDILVPFQHRGKLNNAMYPVI